MFAIIESNKYVKNLKKYKRSGQWPSIKPALDLLISKLQDDGHAVFSDMNLQRKYADHELYENRQYASGTREVHVKPNVLLIYSTDKINSTVTLITIDSHSGARVTSSVNDIDASIFHKLNII